MIRKTIGLLIGLFFLQLFLQAEMIQKISVEGNERVSRETVLFYMKSREGSVYSEEMLRDDFKSLWGTGFFENIRITSDDGVAGKIVRVILTEHLFISAINYKTGRRVTQKAIEEKLQENSIALLPFSHFNPAKLKRVESVIRDLLLEKGFGEGKVDVVPKVKGNNVELTINVEQGPKTRIGGIVFPGLDNKKVSGLYLRGGMKNNKKHGLWNSIIGKDVYNREKLPEDMDGLRLRLQQKGYLEAKVGEPSASMMWAKSFWGNIRRMMRISVPIDLGSRYRMGDIKIEGNKIIKGEYLYQFVKLKKGKVYNIKKRNKYIEEIQKFYRTLGYFYCQVVPIENLDPVKQIADLTLRISENEVSYLGKLEFVGNTFTKDHVIRREWLLKEGMRLNVTALENSLRRMKQLGLVTIDKMPELKPDPKDPTKIDILCEVREMNRQMINFNIGYSGFDGFFIALGYQTQNFMGLGETLGVNFQHGTRSKNYSFSFTEPYLFNLPASLGINVFKRAFDYPGLFTQDSTGFNVSSSFRFWRFWGSSLMYSYEFVEIPNIEEDLFARNSYMYLYYGQEGRRKISSISPTIYYTTVDSPIFPTNGTKYLLNYRYSGGVLGGDVNLHKLKLEFVKFIPLMKRHTVGLHLVYQGLKSFGEKEVPFYERYFLGGERSIRGFDIYQLGPMDERGYPMGGNKTFFINFEYQISMTEQFALIGFFDVGNAYDFGEPIDFGNVYSSMGLEVKVFIPMFGVPFRLIFSHNPRRLRPYDKHFEFRFAVGPSFS